MTIEELAFEIRNANLRFVEAAEKAQEIGLRAQESGYKGDEAMRMLEVIDPVMLSMANSVVAIATAMLVRKGGGGPGTPDANE